MTTSTLDLPAEETVPAPTPAAARTATQLIPIAAIARNPAQPRRVFDPDRLKELAASIRLVGQLQPIVVLRQLTPVADPDDPSLKCEYLLVMGERRWRAMRLLAGESPLHAPFHHIEAKIYEGVSEAFAFEMALRENLDREQLNPIEEAAALRDAKDRYGFTQKQLEGIAHRSRSRLANILRLLDLPAPVQDMLSARQLLAGHGEALLRFAKWPIVCEEIAQRAVITQASQATLEQPLPFAAELHRAGIVSRIEEDSLATCGMDYDDAKVFARLKALAYVIVVKAPNSWESDDLYALDPAQWGAWLSEQREAFLARNRKLVEEMNAEIVDEVVAAEPASPVAGAPGPKTRLPKRTNDPVDLGKLGYGSYKLLSDLPPAVAKQIPAATVEIGVRWPGEAPVKFTRDVKFVDGLLRAIAVKKNRAARELLDAAMDGATVALQSVTKLRPEDLAMLVSWIHLRPESRRQALADLKLAPGAKWEDLAPADVVRAVILARLRDQWHDARRGASSVPSDLAQYAGDYRVAAKEKRAAAAPPAKPAISAAKLELAPDRELTHADRAAILAWDVEQDGPLTECAQRFSLTFLRVRNLRLNASRKPKGKRKSK